MNILFICTANLFRSQTAEAVARRHLQDLGLGHKHKVASCGMSQKIPMGRSVPGKIRQWLEENGYEVKADAQSKAVSWELVDWAHQIVLMNEHQSQLLGQRYTSHIIAHNKKCHLLGQWVIPRIESIPDPMSLSGDKLQNVMRLIESAVKTFCEGLL